MKIKYDSGVTPFRGKVRGGIYQAYRYGQQITTTKKNGRGRYPFQWDTSGMLIQLSRAWRGLNSTQKNAWIAWASTYPQETNHLSGVYLAAYQNFIKRNFYQLLFFGRNADLILEPVLTLLDATEITLDFYLDASQLLMNYSFDRTGSDIWAGVFVSRVNSAGLIYPGTKERFMGVIANEGGLKIKYGLIYNAWFDFTSNPPCVAGSSIPTYAQILALNSHLGGSSVAGGKMKETGLDYWQSPNTGATNSSGFTGRAGGIRNPSSGSFSGINQRNYIHTSTVLSGTYVGSCYLSYNNTVNYTSNWLRKQGSSLRVIKDATGVSDGTLTSYTGVDGKVYSMVAINGLYWLTSNLCETKLRDGTPISEVQIASSWLATTSPAMCAFDNDWSNAFSSGGNTFDASDGFSKYFGIIPASGEWILVRIVKVGKENGQFLGEQQFQVQIA